MQNLVHKTIHNLTRNTTQIKELSPFSDGAKVKSANKLCPIQKLLLGLMNLTKGKYAKPDIIHTVQK